MASNIDYKKLINDNKLTHDPTGIKSELCGFADGGLVGTDEGGLVG